MIKPKDIEKYKKFRMLFAFLTVFSAIVMGIADFLIEVHVDKDELQYIDLFLIMKALYGAAGLYFAYMAYSFHRLLKKIGK